MERDRTVGAGGTFLVTDADGRTDGTNAERAGAYHRDTRHLDRYDLDGDLEPLTAVAPRPGERLTHLGRPAVDGVRTRHVARRQFLRHGTLAERVTVSNLTSTPGEESLRLRLGTRFDDLFEVRGYVDDDRHRVVGVAPHGDRGVRFTYDPPDVERSWRTGVRVALDGERAGDEVDVTLEEGDGRGDAGVELGLDLAGHETRTVDVCVRFEGDADEAVAGAVAATGSWVRDRATAWEEATALDAEWPDVVARSQTALLDLRLESGAFAAGVPWYATTFGRDSLVAAYQALPLSTDPAVATCRYLAARQATTRDEFRAAEPGKIPHEVREGELAARGVVPHTPYYGTVDATPLFVVVVHETWRWTGDDAFLRECWPHVERALRWCARRLEESDEGFVAYPTDGHLRHVGWKDSPDGVVYPDGTDVAGPVALAEVQGYVYDAHRRGAALARRLGRTERAADLDEVAETLRDRFDDSFWVASEGTYAVALDGETRVETVTTNPGHCLWSGVVPPDRAERVVDRLLADDVFSGWGFRTLAASHDAYNPQSYHRGSVWPHDTALCALGMRRYGFESAAREVSAALVAAERATDGSLPELFAGFAREETEVPVEYGSACDPQAWAAGAPVACLRAVGAVDGPGLDPGDGA